MFFRAGCKLTQLVNFSCYYLVPFKKAQTKIYGFQNFGKN
jgi:hypothetical protein